MTPPDPMAQAALKAASFASKFDFYLLGAASQDLDRETRAGNLTRVFTNWPKLCRAMAVLAEIAPNAAAKGMEEDARMMDFIEGSSRESSRSSGSALEGGQ